MLNQKKFDYMGNWMFPVGILENDKINLMLLH